MATPSLAMIPSGYKASKVYSVLPESGVGDFDFTRATTATRINSSGLIEEMAINVPRLEYPLIDGVVNGCPSLILEPQRTNVITQSEDFSNSIWSETGANVVSGFISPNGGLDAYKLVEDTSTLRHSTNTLNSVLGEHTFSVFAKKGEKDILQLSLGGAAISPANTYSNFDLTNGVITAGTNTSSEIEELANGWYRCSITSSVVSGILNSGCVIANSKTMGRNGTYQGDGTSGLYIYGAQLEEGSYPTSYIPTNGAAVTRNGETCNGAGDATTFSDSEGVLMIETSALADSNNFRNFSLSDGTTSNLISFIFTNINVIRIDFTNQATLFDTETDIKNNNKILISYKLNEVKLYVNGFLKDIDTNAIMPIGLDTLRFDNTIGAPLHSKTKQIQYFQTVLTDSELETLTSWTSFTDLANGQQYSII